jgi:4-amino-4-deoxy-L-arabinose transferase-like glycosyltransferase
MKGPGPTRQGLWLAVALAITLLGYLYHLDGRNILSIGDEEFYLQITRMTAEQGKLLPLVCERGICDDKPPLLFWQGVASTDWARHWNLWALRLPIVLYTAATAVLVALLAGRLAGNRRTGWLAALLFTAAFSTVQHGRPFLTNQPETFWLFAPVVVLLVVGELSWPVAIVSGLCLGMGALYKSFFLVVPVTAAFGFIQLRRRRWDLLQVLRQDAGRLTAMAGIGLSLFALWLVLDPFPGAIVHDFIGRENVRKFRHGSYLTGLVSGKYSAITSIWLGNFANFGFLALALLALVAMTLLRWRKGSAGVWVAAGGHNRPARAADADDPLTDAERDLWCYVVAFCIVYTAPHQRQENYILPTVAALSVLLALRWERIPAWLLRLSGAAAAVFIGALAWLIHGLPHAIPDVTYVAWQLAGIAALLALALSTIVGTGDGVRWRLPAAVAGTWLALGLALSPFDGPFVTAPGGPGLEALRGRTILFPSTFQARHERFRFDVPGSQVAPYDPRDSVATARLVAQGWLMALPISFDASPPGGHTVYAERFDLRTRIPLSEVREIFLHRRFDLLVQRLVIIEGRREGARQP